MDLHDPGRRLVLLLCAWVVFFVIPAAACPDEQKQTTLLGWCRQLRCNRLRGSCAVCLSLALWFACRLDAAQGIGGKCMQEFVDPAVRETMGAAAYEAAQSRADDVQPEHVWIALLRRPEPVVGRTIAELQISRSKLVQDLELLVYGPDDPTRREARTIQCPGLGSETRRLISDAEVGATRAGRDSVTIRDLFLAFLNGSSGRLRDVFQRYGLSIQRVEQVIPPEQ
jgi:hypothetical protein